AGRRARGHARSRGGARSHRVQPGRAARQHLGRRPALTARALRERPLVVAIPSYQNARYWERNLQSVLEQDYASYRVLYTDDASTDGTAEQVAAYARRHPQ